MSEENCSLFSGEDDKLRAPVAGESCDNENCFLLGNDACAEGEGFLFIVSEGCEVPANSSLVLLEGEGCSLHVIDNEGGGMQDSDESCSSVGNEGEVLAENGSCLLVVGVACAKGEGCFSGANKGTELCFEGESSLLLACKVCAECEGCCPLADEAEGAEREVCSVVGSEA